MRSPIRIRYQLQGQPELAEAFRDVQRAFDSLPTVLLRKIDAMYYTEPLILSNLEQEPEAIELIRVFEVAAPETPVVGAGGVCHYVWLPQEGGARITSINGMSLAANGGKKYRFTFRLTYAAVGGFNV